MSPRLGLDVSWSDLLSRPKPTRIVFYGDDPNHLAELGLPDGPGPHPVAAPIHGGGREAATATHSYLDYAAAAIVALARGEPAP